MNIILNSYCNLKCNYCFADEYMEENVKTPGKSMDYDFFAGEMLPRVKNVTLINFMGGEPTLHPRFNDMLSSTLKTMQPFTYLGVFTNGLMPEKDSGSIAGDRRAGGQYRAQYSILGPLELADQGEYQREEPPALSRGGGSDSRRKRLQPHVQPQFVFGRSGS